MNILFILIDMRNELRIYIHFNKNLFCLIFFSEPARGYDQTTAKHKKNKKIFIFLKYLSVSIRANF